jgi:hypothetical protein
MGKQAVSLSLVYGKTERRATFLAPYARIIHFSENASKTAEVFFTETIEWFIEDQAFLPPCYDLLPRQ